MGRRHRRRHTADGLDDSGEHGANVGCPVMMTTPRREYTSPSMDVLVRWWGGKINYRDRRWTEVNNSWYCGTEGLQNSNNFYLTLVSMTDWTQCRHLLSSKIHVQLAMSFIRSLCHASRSTARQIPGQGLMQRRCFATPADPSTLPLAGIRVLDMTRVLAGVSSSGL